MKNTKEVDSALTRPGRCFDVLEFRLLTADEATYIREQDGLPFVDFHEIGEEDGIDSWSLAEVLNYRAGYVRESKKTGNQFGFARAN